MLQTFRRSCGTCWGRSRRTNIKVTLHSFNWNLRLILNNQRRWDYWWKARLSQNLSRFVFLISFSVVSQEMADAWGSYRLQGLPINMYAWWDTRRGQQQNDQVFKSAVWTKSREEADETLFLVIAKISSFIWKILKLFVCLLKCNLFNINYK